MKKKFLSLILIICILLNLVGCSSQSNTDNSDTTQLNVSDLNQYYNTTFGQGNITNVNIEISEENWQAILDNPTTEEYYSANLTVNGTSLENVGFRAKGFSSLTSVAQSESNRYGFKVKVDKYEKNQTLNGLDEFVLNANFADPSYMREYLTYSAMASLSGITPFLSYTNLYINGELFGFYLCIEAYDDSFVERFSSSEDTCLYKAVSENCTLLPSDDASGFDLKYGADENNQNIKTLIETLNSTTSENKSTLENILDIHSVLKSVALNTVMGNYDSYSGSKAHNYYLLYTEDKFSYIGWDYNMSIDGFSQGPSSSVTVDINNPVSGVNISERPLIGKLLAIDEYKSLYLDYVNQLLEYFSDFETDVTNLSNLIGEYVENDPSAFYTFDQFKSNIASSGTDLSNSTELQGEKSPMPNSDNVEMSPSLDGASIPEMPNDAMPLEMPNGEIPHEIPSNNNTERPDRPDRSPENGNMEFSSPNNKGDKMGGGILNNIPVSIIDYITQRIENIKLQLES